MLSNLLSKFYQPNRPSLGPILTITKLLCVWPSNRPILKTLIYYSSVLLNIIYIICIYIKLIVNFNYNYFVDFVQYSAFHLGLLKTSSYIIRRQDWKVMLELLFEIERESTAKTGSPHAAIVLKYRKYCQFLTYAFWITSTPMVFFLMLFYWIYNVLVPDLKDTENLEPFRCFFCAWFPFDENTRAGRYISAILQTEFAVSGAIYTWTWDAMVLSAMVFLTGQLKALRERCVYAIDVTDEINSRKNIIKCHQHYLSIIKCYKIFKSIVSPVMFIHFLHVTINCGICIINLAEHKENLSSMSSVIDVLVGLNFQLLLFYWIANEVIIQALLLLCGFASHCHKQLTRSMGSSCSVLLRSSLSSSLPNCETKYNVLRFYRHHLGQMVAYGLFESAWVDSSRAVRRAVLMLGIGMRHRIAFKAGPFNEMSLPTFVSILRASYSFYAFLSQKE